MKLFVARVLLVLCALNVPAFGAGDGPKPAAVSTMFPFTPLPAWPVPLVPVQINGKTTATFALDTGTNFSAVTDTLAAKLGLVPTPYLQGGKPYQILGKPATAVTLHDIQAGRFVFRKERVLILPESSLSALLQQPIDGLIGLDLLRHFAVELDYPSHQITLFSPGLLSTDALQGLGFRLGDAAPLQTETQTGLYRATGRFRSGANAGREEMLVDTGSGATAISSTLAKQLALVPVQAGGHTSMLSGTFTINTARVPVLQFGGVTATDATVVYPDRRDEKYGPLLGVDLLSQYRVLLDFPAKKMYLRANPAAGPAPTPSGTADKKGP